MSAVPGVQQDLLDLLGAASALDGVFIRFAQPLEQPKISQPERIYVIDEADFTLGGGEQYRSESFTARLIVEVERSGDKPKETSDRRWALIDAIDAALMDDNFHGYATEGFHLKATSRLVAREDGKGYIASSLVSIGQELEV